MTGFSRSAEKKYVRIKDEHKHCFGSQDILKLRNQNILKYS